MFSKLSDELSFMFIFLKNFLDVKFGFLRKWVLSHVRAHSPNACRVQAESQVRNQGVRVGDKGATTWAIIAAVHCCSTFERSWTRSWNGTLNLGTGIGVRGLFTPRLNTGSAINFIWLP